MKHLSSLFMIAALLLVLLSACGGGETPVANQPAESPAEESTGGSEEKITLRLWSHTNPAFIAVNQELIDKFMQENPNIEVTYEQFEYGMFIQTLQTSMEAGTEADVIEMFGSWVCDYAGGDRLLAVPDSLMTYDQAKDVFFQSQLDGYYCDEKLYGFPKEYNFESSGILISPTMFKEAGLEYPPQWETFEDVLADGQKLTKFDESGVMTVSGLDMLGGDSTTFVILASILELGGSYRADDGLHFDFTTPEAEQAAQLYVDMAQKYKVVDPVIFGSSGIWFGDAFFTGQAAMAFGGTWLAGFGVEAYPDVEFDYVPLPPYFGSKHQYAADAGWGNVVSANTKHAEAAWKLVEFLALNEDSLRTFNAATGTIPAMVAVAGNPGEILDKAPFVAVPLRSDAMVNGRYIGPLGDRDRFFYEIININIEKAMLGELTVQEALQQIETSANELIDSETTQ